MKPKTLGRCCSSPTWYTDPMTPVVFTSFLRGGGTQFAYFMPLRMQAALGLRSLEDLCAPGGKHL